MKVICKVCNGKGKVNEDFGLGNCERIPGDILHRVCPACNGTGLQEEDRDDWPFKPPYKKKKIQPIDPFRPPYPHPQPPFPFDPYGPYDPLKRRKRHYWYISIK